MKQISVIGIDIAKHIFQLHGIDDRGREILKKTLRRNKLLEFIASLPSCTIAMEACGGAHHWARRFQELGHCVRLIPGEFVRPYVKTNKNDASDAAAIAEAATRAHMRFVPVKTTEQQTIQSWHRARHSSVSRRTALINECHGMLLEYGLVASKGKARLISEITRLSDPECDEIPPELRLLLCEYLSEFKRLDEAIKRCDRKIAEFSSRNEVCERLQQIPGVGVLTATAIVASVGSADHFKNGRQFSAFYGLVPRQYSTGGKTVLRGISKRGDSYIRCLLIHGGRAVITQAKRRSDRLSQWALEKEKTRGRNKAIVAIANKNARVIWKLMKTGESYKAA